MVIQYLKRDQIDDKKWNGCVHFALNNYPYGYTWYLDNICETWDGLVSDNYEMVFPLVWNRKLSIDYLYQPFFTQQLGLFSIKPISQQILNRFLDHIPAQFKFIDINLNYMNPVSRDDYIIEERVSYVLDLQEQYPALASKYSSNLKRNLKKASQNDLQIHNNLQPEDVVKFFREHTAPKIKGIKESHYHSLHRIIYWSMHYGLGTTYGVYDSHNQLLATAFFLSGKNKIINILPSTSTTGKQQGASHLLLDHIIRINAGTPRTFDFEGSMIPTIAQFYKSFGSSPLTYWHLKRNQLPWYLQLFKK